MAIEARALDTGKNLHPPPTSELRTANQLGLQNILARLEGYIDEKMEEFTAREEDVESWTTEVRSIDGEIKRQSSELEHSAEVISILLELKRIINAQPTRLRKVL